MAKAERRLPFGPAALERTYAEIEAMFLGAADPVRLCILAARFAGQMHNTSARSEWLLKAEQRMATSGDLQTALELLSEGCWDLHRADGPDKPTVQEYLTRLFDYATRLQANWALAQYALQRLSHALYDEVALPSLMHTEAVAAVARLDVDDVWAVFPAIGPLAKHLLESDRSLWTHLAMRIGDPEGPFARAQFEDVRAGRALVELVDQARKTPFFEGRQKDVSWAELGIVRSIENLTNAWPYAVLRVQPPYGSRSRTLRESAA